MLLPYKKYADFESAGKAVLKYLHERIGFGLWMITRSEGEDWVVLDSLDHFYDVSPNDVFQWTDSFCSRMVAGHGPRIAPCSDAIPCYQNAPIGKQVPIGAYVGVPLAAPDGSLFGTLCAIDPATQPEAIIHELPLVELLAGMLGTILDTELKALNDIRRLEQAKHGAMTDPLTGLFNHRGWDSLLLAEEYRCKRYGHKACLLSLRVNDLQNVNDRCGDAIGNEILKSVSSVLQNVFRESDVIARLSYDEFGILAVDYKENKVQELTNQLEEFLGKRSIDVTIGHAISSPKETLVDTMLRADQQLRLTKQPKKSTHQTAR